MSVTGVQGVPSSEGFAFAPLTSMSPATPVFVIVIPPVIELSELPPPPVPTEQFPLGNDSSVDDAPEQLAKVTAEGLTVKLNTVGATLMVPVLDPVVPASAGVAVRPNMATMETAVGARTRQWWFR